MPTTIYPDASQASFIFNKKVAVTLSVGKISIYSLESRSYYTQITDWKFREARIAELLQELPADFASKHKSLYGVERIVDGLTGKEYLQQDDLPPFPMGELLQ